MPSNPPSARALGEERCVRCGKPKSEHYDAITPNGDERFCYRIEEAGTLDRELARFVAPPSPPAAREPETEHPLSIIAEEALCLRELVREARLGQKRGARLAWALAQVAKTPLPPADRTPEGNHAK